MNIAFGAVLLFVIFLPGWILRRSYLSGPFSKHFIRSSPSEEIFWSILPGLFLHAVLLWVGEFLTNYQVNIKTLGLLLTGAQTETASAALTSISENKWVIAIYYFAACVVALGAGNATREIVRWRNWDKSYRFFRFNNEWHYLLSGEILDFPKIPGKPREISFVWIDALVQTGEGGSVIYSGILQDYQLSSDGGLESIYLRDVARRNLADDPGDSEQSAYTIPGKFFVIRYCHTLNLNVTYYEVEELTVSVGDQMALNDDVQTELL